MWSILQGRVQTKENREKLCSIVETIMFCGWQEISLRDSGQVTVNEPTIKDGNFRALLRIRMKCGDQKLIYIPKI